MRRNLQVLLIALVVATATCGGEDEPPAPATVPPTTAAPSPSPTLVATTCEVEPATSLSATWQTHQGQDGGFSFSYPGNWEDLTGQVTYEADELISEDTLTEAGLDPNAQVPADLVRDPSGEVNLTVVQVEGVATSTDVAYQRQATRVEELPAVEQLLGTELAACAGGEPALGIDFLFTAPRADTGEEQTFYQRSYFFVHESTLYATQILAVDMEDGEILEEAIRTWQWSDAVTGAPAGAALAEAATTAEIDPGADAPDPSTYSSTFTSDVPIIYVVYRLEEGVGGDVETTWTREGETVYESSRTLPSDGTWAYEGLQAPAGGHELGAYEVTLTVVDTGETKVLQFTVVA
jgi:hypothetical protein